ncbi:threonine aldolase family protein [Marinifilum flexuosum]|uniref:L-threonine aldolase n=1 Tax=Marinifilum flexuosum TaxID=1117708 RepID=A0A419XBM9_9BACT|nr:low specificity L-threonine aldolase [Marinifilum flexuosum]RKE04979.1 L-threonine aldolase [Marinifilum flexuosum]
MKRSFASDNYSGIHSEILKTIAQTNNDHSIAYGNDEYTKRAIIKIKEHFGNNIATYFVFNGTAANVLALKAITNSFNSIICANSSHINVDECGAPENYTRCKLLPIETVDGKVTKRQVEQKIVGIGDQHHAQPKVISITQPTELGVLYSGEEIKELAKLAHDNNMYLHMDGARLSNAAASLNQSLKQASFDLGVDVLSFGGTKNGLMFGEAILFRNSELSKNFQYIRKQGMQLYSKMRFISAQFEAILNNDLWLENAKHSNQMASFLANELAEIPSIKITQKVETNSVFAIVPKKIIAELQKQYSFYLWNEDKSEVRWMCTFDTRKEDILSFVSFIKELLNNFYCTSVT